MKNVRNQSGITLIELLAALVIGTMVIGLITTVLLSTFTQADVTGNHANLRQEANIVLSQMRTEYSDQSTGFVLEFDDTDRQLNIGPDVDNLSTATDQDLNYEFEKIIVYQITPENEEINRIEFEDGTLNNSDPVTFGSPAANRLYVNFILKDESGLTFEVDTMISRLGDYEDYQVEEDDEPQDYDALLNAFIIANELSPSEYEFEGDGDIFIQDESIQISAFDYKLPIFYALRQYENNTGSGPDNHSLVYTTGSLSIADDDFDNDTIIVSKGNVSVTDMANLRGLIFAPDGVVTIADSDFTGTIIADRLEITGDSTVDHSEAFIMNLLSDEEEVPFEFEAE